MYVQRPIGLSFFGLMLLIMVAGLTLVTGGLLCAAENPNPCVHHDMNVSLDPVRHEIRVHDRITLTPELAKQPSLTMVLHGGMVVDPAPGGFEMRRKIDRQEGPDGINGAGGEPDSGFVLVEYELAPVNGNDYLPDTIELSYHGTIHHALQSSSEEYARSFSQTHGIISEEGTMLSASSGWYPRFDDGLLTFRMEVRIPEGRSSMTQGRLVSDVTRDQRRCTVWNCPHPMDDIYLIEAPFIEYEKPVGEIKAQALLRNPDPGLAGKYLDATAQYLEMYNELIGPYPYSKFALVENFWETGYGMPSFTLLGSKVIRFPFILQSSYPHEILHNWWGNSVFVDYEKGNWCEGITAYLADHLMKEVKGQGQDYRRDTLQRYVNFVRSSKDFPLIEFRSRHDAATEAIGYGKSLMVYHMLRMRIGDRHFKEGLQEFYRQFAYKRATFMDLANVFSNVSGEELVPYFKTWTERTGAPKLELACTRHSYSRSQGTRLTITLSQVQEEDPFPMQVPVALHVGGRDKVDMIIVNMDERTETVGFRSVDPVFKVEVDPGFDLFRKLDREEIPPTIGQVFGAEKVLIVLPDEGIPSMQPAWKELAKRWASDQGGHIEIRSSSDVKYLPPDQAVWVFGRDNPWKPGPDAGLSAYGVSMDDKTFTLPDTTLPFLEHTLVLSARHPNNPDLALCWIAADLSASVPGLGRKLPHYGKYSYLAFEGTEPTNVAKGQWPLIHSPMQVVVNADVSPGDRPSLPKRIPLAEPPALVDMDKLKAHIAVLADDKMQGRGLGTTHLDEAADYIARSFGAYGLKPGGEMASYFQAWQERIEGMPKTDKGGQPVFMKNVVAVIPGRDARLKNEWVVVGAHYDHLGLGWPDVRHGNEGQIHNGADDNASGVAVLLELARMLVSQGFAPAHSTAFVAFTGEEAGLLGSRHFVKNAEALLGGPVVSMVNLDTVGRLGEGKVMVFGTYSAREWPFIMMGCGYVTGLSVENISKDPGTGDQVSFLEAGIPAIHIFSGPHADYHRPGDDVDKIDFKGLSKIVEFTREAVVHLADRTEPLDVKIAKSGAAQAHPGSEQAGAGHPSSGHPGQASGHPGKKPAQSGRRASLGTMPDFAWQQGGVRVAAVTEGSPAAGAGIEQGDVIVGINDISVEDLRGFSNALKSFKPGDQVTVKITRDEEKLSFEVTLGAR